MRESAALEPDFDDIEQFLVSGSAGDSIFEVGDPGAELYFIKEGEVELIGSVDGDEVSLARLAAGDFFGELSLFEEGCRTVTARAVTDCKLLRIDRDAFDRVVEESPAIAVSMVRKLARRLRDREAQLASALQAVPSGGEDAERPEAAEPAAPKAEESQAVERQKPAAVGTGALVHPGSGLEFRLPADADELLIGRVDPATGVMPDIDFSEIDTRQTLSRRHATISRREDGFYLCEAAKTSNGTFLNSKRIETGMPVKLEDGDKVRFGLVDMVFKVD